MMVVAALLLIANTIRVAAFSRRRETGIMRLVGASNLYIQLPFVLESDDRGAGRCAARGRDDRSSVKGVLIDRRLAPTFQFTQLHRLGRRAGGRALAGRSIALVIAALAALVALRRYLRI